jgi:hypothetical protein
MLKKFAIYITNREYPSSLNKRGRCEALPDSDAGKVNLILVLNGLGEA